MQFFKPKQKCLYINDKKVPEWAQTDIQTKLRFQAQDSKEVFGHLRVENLKLKPLFSNYQIFDDSQR